METRWEGDGCDGGGSGYSHSGGNGGAHSGDDMRARWEVRLVMVMIVRTAEVVEATRIMMAEGG